MFDGFTDFGEQAKGVCHRELLLEGVIGEGQPADVFHDVVETPLGDAAVEDGDDVGMVEAADQLDLALEAAFALRPSEGAFEHDLEGHLPLGGELDGLIDHALPAAVEFLENLVARDRIRRRSRTRFSCCRLDRIGFTPLFRCPAVRMLDVLEERTLVEKRFQRGCTIVALLHMLFDVRKFSPGEFALCEGREPCA